ncbi:MAG: hypothetical protein ACXVFU_17630 [Nocardioidaceae bacterium]
MTAHLDRDALADVLAGERSDPHLDGCAECRAALAELATAVGQVEGALAALPAPAVPAGAEERLLAALAREGAGTAGEVVPAGPAPATVTVMPADAGPGARSRPRWLPVAGGVAAAAVLVTAGVLLSRGGTTTAGRTAGAPGSQIARSSTGTSYAKDGKALAAALPALLKGGASSAAGAQSAPRAATTSGTTSGSADPLAALRGDGLAPCLASLSDPSDPGVPLALDYAGVEGKPALVVVFPASESGKVDVFVVGARCTAQDADVLFFTRLSKP